MRLRARVRVGVEGEAGQRPTVAHPSRARATLAIQPA